MLIKSHAVVTDTNQLLISTTSSSILTIR